LDLPGLRKGSAGKYLPSFVDAYFNSNNEGNYLETDDEIRVEIKCVDFKSVDFVLQKKCNERKPFLQSLKASIQWTDIKSTYMVAMPQISPVQNRFLDPAAVYNPFEEYRRLGLDSEMSGGMWRISDCNVNYTVCDTYPAFVCVPNSMPDAVRAKNFRSQKWNLGCSYFLSLIFRSWRRRQSIDLGEDLSQLSGSIPRLARPSVDVLNLE
jgi:hypothetical protein